MPNLIRFAGVSGSGKTTLIQELLKEFQKRGLSTACIKHSHHDLELPKKDSTLLFTASTDGSIVVGENVVSITLPLCSKTPQQWAEFLFPETDLIIVEGWRKFDLPTILFSSDLPPNWKRPKTIIATIGKHHFPNIPCYSDPNQLPQFILEQLRNGYLDAPNNR